MANGSPSLADLVTQAPLDDESGNGATASVPPAAQERTAAEQPGACRRPPPARRCCLCRRRPETRLAAIVPVESPPEDDRCELPEPKAVASQAPVLEGAATPSAPPAQEVVALAPPPQASAVLPEAGQLPQAAAVREDKSRQKGQLGPQVAPNIGRKTLVLDLDETLIHSSFRVVPTAELVISVELEGETHSVYVRKRPGVDHLLTEMSQLYEVVVYTASMPQYANKLLDQLDKGGAVSRRLFRDACTRTPGGYVKDLSKLGRDLKDVIIIDNSPICYSLQPSNAIPIKTWRDDPNDRELYDLVPILYSLVQVEDVPTVLEQVVWTEDE
mmetsp:Transcript_89184/g.237029  ORF Transcript_89184/g.237029 Transcript_89184/m.237029 type:complete len:329 (-) Transcript_89184:155-1141(-)